MKKLSEFDHITTPDDWIDDALNIEKENKTNIIHFKTNQKGVIKTTRIARHFTKSFVAVMVILLVLSAGTLTYFAANKIAMSEKEKSINEKPFVIMLTGSDKYGDDLTKNERNDVNILVAVNPKTKKLAVISTDRDSYVYVKQAEGSDYRSGYDKLTNTSVFGMDTCKKTLENLYQIPIDYYSKVNFSGMPEFIDALGGITIYSDCDFSTSEDASSVKYTFQKGENKCDGDMALAFCRERKAFSDGSMRSRNQIRVVQAVLDKLMTNTILYDSTRVIDAISNMLLTDMTKETMIALIKGQINDLSEWECATYYVGGINSVKNLEVTELPKMNVVIPSQDSISEAKNQINRIINEK